MSQPAQVTNKRLLAWQSIATWHMLLALCLAGTAIATDERLLAWQSIATGHSMLLYELMQPTLS